MSTEELLRRLREVDPVDPQLLDRVVGEILAAARWADLAPEPEEGASKLAAVIPIKGEPARRRGHRLGALARGRVMRATAVSSAALVAVVATLAGLGDLPTRNAPLPSHHVAAARGARAASTGFQLVDATTSPFATVAAGSNAGDLLCVTATTCYADANTAGPFSPEGVERTTDGGRTWHFVAAIPGGTRRGGALLRWPLACPTTEMCMGVVDEGLADPAGFRSFVNAQHALGRNNLNIPSNLASEAFELVVTTDGGAHWSVEKVDGSSRWLSSLGSGSGGQVSCATDEVCTLSRGTQLLVTTDGGSTWTKEPPLQADRIRCDASGKCIAVQTPGNVHSQSIVALRSTNFGKTWTAGPPGPLAGAILHLDCADTSHCMAVYPFKGGFKVTHTANAGRSWQLSTVPTTSPYGPAKDVTSISCANGTDCWIAVSAGPVVHSSGLGKVLTRTAAYTYRTQDGGATWTELPLPTVKGAPLVIVYPMSCPSTLGCIAVGATEAQAHPRQRPGKPFTVSSREIISNLPTA